MLTRPVWTGWTMDARWRRRRGREIPYLPYLTLHLDIHVQAAYISYTWLPVPSGKVIIYIFMNYIGID